ncbi:acetyl-CoA carboxylase carboxyl transferase subunit alpha [Actinomadura soli]|uniref:Multifunctional fusion protein n=1 Tax=Actinomadura soli TaxID=2508997 RepID=A0A5C4J5W5_9ACTN|nr:acetyl-CoA carboxylase carboxyl transferase subunit alpha [Actinomadura soli]TMQ91574.1 acetyl-CoA carboxylase carboxyl transferase subunit alpha [Actinomadura soli]
MSAGDRADGAAAGTDWVLCRRCRAMSYGRRFARNLHVCPDCGHHHMISARERLGQLLDPGSAREIELPAATRDVLGFVDTRRYPERLAQARHRTGLREGVIVADGTIEGHPLVVAVMDFEFLGGSLGAAVGDLVAGAAETALARGVPLLIVAASGGARMQEGPISLMQMARTSQALARLDEAGILTISLITDPTFGGVAASFATQTDVIIAEPAARLGFAGRRVIEQTIGRELPAAFQTAEFLLERGFVDAVTPRHALRTELRRLLAAARPGGPGPVPAVAPGTLVRDAELLDEIDPWKAVQQARDLSRPTTLDYLGHAFHDFVELRGDRVGGDCPAIVGGTALLGRRPVMVIGHQRGHTAGELSARNFGMPNPAGYRKAARLMATAAKLGLPVVTFVDTPGAHPGVEAEEQGQALAIARCIRTLADLPVPVVTVIIGEGGSGGALALAVADEVLIGERGVYSVISPEGCASILWKDAAKAPEAAAALRVDARSLLRMGVVDGVVREPDGGGQADPREAARRVAAVLAGSLSRLCALEPGELVRARRDRYRSFGSGLSPGLSSELDSELKGEPWSEQ